MSHLSRLIKIAAESKRQRERRKAPIPLRERVETHISEAQHTTYDVDVREALCAEAAHTRDCFSTLHSPQARHLHHKRVKRERASLHDLFNEVREATHPHIVKQAHNAQWQLFDWPLEDDPLFGAQARAFVRGVQAWVATPSLERTEALTAIKIATLAVHVMVFQGLETVAGESVEREKERGKARAEWHQDAKVRRVLMRETRGRRSRLRHCVSADEV
ncbi:unnamed protein product [Clonostachys byssicola]|uniref:Uncharacterized protein n=1 Tax=Clonostachys byssicola TaxID=160290 RepID=A0A9N9Y3X7_9HYPO|nr:unnamed protein product [Clonostachys byssicola]